MREQRHEMTDRLRFFATTAPRDPADDVLPQVSQASHRHRTKAAVGSIKPRRLSNWRLIYRAGGKAVHFFHPARDERSSSTGP